MDTKKQLDALEKIIKEQAKQMDSMKKAMSVLQNRLMAVTKRAERAYYSGIKNTNSINSINNTLHRNR